MKKLLGLGLAIVSCVTLAPADSVRIYTVPRGPSREALDRLSLTAAWKARIPLDGRRDGIFSFQIIPYKNAPQIVIQSFAGAVTLLDAETGDLLWRTMVGQPYWTARPAGYNDTNIFVTRRTQLHVLNRQTGQERVYSLDKDSKLPIWGMRVPLVPSAAPVAEDDMLYVPFNSQVTAYHLPIFEEDERLRESEVKAKTPLQRPSLQPEYAWNFVTAPIAVEQSPIVGDDYLGIVGTGGTFLLLNKYSGVVQYSYKVPGVVNAPMGHIGNKAYIGTEDGTVYALDMRNGRLQWRLFGNGAITRGLEVTKRDTFVAAQRTGLYRVDRQLGHELWLNRSADRFLATNQRFVYALDRQGALLILDYERGTALASYDMRDWTVHLGNELTDRIYLASHDGQVLCLHHRDQRKPLDLRPPDVPAPKQEEKKEMPAPDAEKKEPEQAKDADKEKVGGLNSARPAIGAAVRHRTAWAWQPDNAERECCMSHRQLVLV